MTDTSAHMGARSAHRGCARLLICGFGGFPGFEANPAGEVVERLRDRRWTTEDAAVNYAVLPTTWSGALEAAAEALRTTDADALLLVGVAGGAESFRVEMRARNRAATTKPDAAGVLFPRERISPLGPAAARASAPVEPMVAALEKAGLPVYASSDAGDYLCNYTFYRMLTEVAADLTSPQTAFLHLPELDRNELERGVSAAATALSRTAAFGPRSQIAAAG